MEDNPKGKYMKKVLMTWYGITDLKASLDIEHSLGPILSALKDGDYTDVLILGYTDPKKASINTENFNIEHEKVRKNFKENQLSDFWKFI